MKHDLRPNNDGNLELIRFPQDGLWIELTQKGLQFGASREGAVSIAIEVKTLHAQEFRAASHIDPAKLGQEIWKHCLAYVACSAVTATKWRSILTGGALVCPWVQKHANPVNVTWPEITY